MKRIILLTLFAFTFSLYSFSQTDTAFWFAVPFATPDHDGPVKAALRITMTDYADTIVIEQPFAPAAFTKIKVGIAAHATFTQSLNNYMFNTNPPSTVTNTVNIIDSYPTGAVTASSWDNNNPIDNNGLHIYSIHKNNFTCYYEQDPSATSPGSNNPDIWVMKGKNALGYDFYVPFQTTWTNQKFRYWPAYSSLDIVATMDNTTVTITLPAGKSAAGAGHNVAGSTFSVTLNRGQTYSVAPKLITETNSNGVNWTTPSRLPADRLCGTYVHANQPIAVTNKDDSDIKSSAYDMVGDQLVPLINIDGDKIIGHKYIVMRGQVTNLSATQGEAIYITTTANNTNIYISNSAGVDSLLTPVPLAKGQQVMYTIPATKSAFTVRGSEPIYVFHVSGFVHEIGGALLPSVDGCTGSLDVSFVRSIGPTTPANMCTNTTYNNLFLNIMTKSTAVDSFYIQIGAAAPQKLGNASWFTSVGDGSWWVLKDIYKCFSTTIPTGTPVRIWNTEDVFHLGLINGVSTGGGCRYGYFSNYNEIKSQAITIESGTNLYTNCELDTIQLQAYGGLMNRYQWFPTDYLIDPPNISNPRAVVPRGWTDFFCKIKQPCAGFDTLRVTVFSPLNPFAFFTIDKSSTCYPDTIIHIANKSENATKYRWTFGDGTPINFTSAPTFTYPYTNRTNTPKVFQIYLETENNDGCLSNFKVPITVNPYLEAGLIASDSVVCHPLDTVHYKQPISFQNTSKGNVTDTSYIWNFGDNNSTDIKSPRHIFYNFFTSKDTIYKVRLVATSPFYCRDTVWKDITVHPYIKAMFTVDSVSGCSPLSVKIHNRSEGAISGYNWDFGDGTIRTDNKDTLNHSFPRNLTSNPVLYKVLLTVNHNFGNGCPDTISRFITVYPEGKVNILTPDTVGCNKLTVNFRASADPGVTQYIWNFNDAGTSNYPNPTHQFENLTNGDVTYNVTIRTTSTQNCAGYDTVKVTVHALLNPVFSIDVPRTCAPYNATITNKSLGGITNYTWDFGDGTPQGSSGASIINHLYHNIGTTETTYTVKLIVKNIGGCKDSVSQNISLYPEVNAGFATTFGSYCSPRQVDFVNNSSATATKFIWKFGDNSTSLARDTTHYYTNNTMRDTIYYAYLIAISDNNCKDSMKSLPILVYPYIEPYFSIDTTIGCNPLTAKIINGSLGPYIEDFWNFGSGANVGPQPKTFSHVFQNTGIVNKTFNIKLQVSYKGICQKPYNKQVTVYPSVIPKVSANRTAVCSNSEIAFRDSSHFTNVAYNYRWDYGDGSTLVNTYPANKSLTEVTKHKYENFGFTPLTPKVILTTYSQRGCQADTTINIVIFPNVKASFSFDDAAGCSPVIVPLKEGSTSIATWKRFWDDEKTPSLGFPYTYLPPSITYRNDTSTANKVFKPKLKVAYLYNGSPVCPDSITRTVTVYPKVTAYFAAKDSFKICQPDTVSFSNGSRIGNYRLLLNDTRLAYKWTYGDNGSSSDYEPKHIYYNFDKYSALVDTVWLKVQSQVGCRDSLKKIVIIYPKPEAIFDIENSLACPPFKVKIDHTSMAEGGSMFNWSFNDGGSDTITRVPIETLYHLFNNSGSTTLTHPINLLVTTPHNCTDTASQKIYIWPPVVADFDKDTAGCNPFTVAFVNKSKQSDSWYWDFGDNVMSKAKSPQHVFFNTSVNDTTYTVSLKSKSKEGCFNDTTKKITVYPQPIANFEADRYYFTYSPSANVVNFTNLSNDGFWNYLWDYNDLLPKDNIKGPTQHEFLLGAPHWGGQFNVKLNVWSNHCSDSISHRITIVAPKPIADFSISENGCVPLTVSFTELTSYGTSWLWEFGDGGTYSGQNPPPYTYYRAGKFNIKLTVTGDGGVSYAFKDVEVYPKPSVNFDLKPNLADIAKIPDNDGTLVWGAKISFYNECGLGEKFLWDFGDSLKSIELAPSHIYKNVGVYTVKLGAWTVHQCYDEIIKKDTIKILGIHKCEFPNAFTPDISGQNDGTYDIKKDTKNYVFHPSWAGVVDYHLEIYDRWGEKLFESNDVTIGWNGYYKGKLCKTDVYIWKATGKYTDGGTFEKAGNVTLLR